MTDSYDVLPMPPIPGADTEEEYTKKLEEYTKAKQLMDEEFYKDKNSKEGNVMGISFCGSKIYWLTLEEVYDYIKGCEKYLLELKDETIDHPYDIKKAILREENNIATAKRQIDLYLKQQEKNKDA